MPVELRNEQKAVRVDAPRLRRQAEFLLASVGHSGSVLSILLTDDRRIAPLHERWMAEPGPTDVLSFPMEEPGILGDIVISVETAARRRPKDPADEILRYLVHGLLHLAGHDHRGKKERIRMNREALRLQRKVKVT